MPSHVCLVAPIGYLVSEMLKHIRYPASREGQSKVKKPWVTETKFI